ncbi:TOMM precursor leader peptide-binding protein [Catellatospora chokoriensis]|uniref:YcaO domain-containing protein n=1 Tax=Catellatospora chokoriensis TaxID=310353 RepID=A0A8J3NNY0_9ACTN|nr:TOMM precursor leader peptide-binding protein [Catellatospora chokoriensis]GIF86593.1 hypothetical protein Cch02nite_00370 [Catellatospora chokoriensis]
MTTAYERVADTRPRVRRDLLFTRTPDGVLFHNSQGGFRVNARTAYRLASLLMPHFTGRNRVADICAGLGADQREMVGELVSALYARDFARAAEPTDDGTGEPILAAAVAERFAAQIAYIDHYADAPETRFDRFRQARIAVLGESPVARWCASSLVRNGAAVLGVVPGGGEAADLHEQNLAEAAELTAAAAPVTILPLGEAGSVFDWADLADYDVVVVAGGERAPYQTLRLLSAGVPEGKTLVPTWVFGERAVVGPLMTAGSAGCWTCSALRLSANGDAGVGAALWSTVALPEAVAAPVRRPGGPLAAMIGNLLGYEVFRIATGALPAETAGKVIIQNLASLDVISERLLPHPRCPHCGPSTAAGDDVLDTSWRTTADVALAAAAAARANAEANADDAADALVEELNARAMLLQPHTGVFVKYTDEQWTQTPLKLSTVELATAAGQRRQVSAFDVHHVAGARRRALHEAAVVYVERAGLLPAADPTLPRLDAAAFGTATGVPAVGDPAGPQTTAVCLTTGEAVQVPVAAVQPSGPANQRRVFAATRAGAGAGADLTEAVGQGLLSALAHRALTAAIRGGEVTRIGLDTMDGDAELTFLVKSAHNLGIRLDLLELPGDGAGHALFARTPAPEGAGWVWAVAADTSWQAAALAAVRDLLGQVQLRQQLPADAAVDCGDPVLGDFDAGTLHPTGSAAATLDAATTWTGVLDALSCLGLTALAVPTTPEDLRTAGIHTARVLLARRADR